MSGLTLAKSIVLSVENFLCLYLDSVNLMRFHNKHFSYAFSKKKKKRTTSIGLNFRKMDLYFEVLLT